MEVDLEHEAKIKRLEDMLAKLIWKMAVDSDFRFNQELMDFQAQVTMERLKNESAET